MPNELVVPSDDSSTQAVTLAKELSSYLVSLQAVAKRHAGTLPAAIAHEEMTKFFSQPYGLSVGTRELTLFVLDAGFAELPSFLYDVVVKHPDRFIRRPSRGERPLRQEKKYAIRETFPALCKTFPESVLGEILQDNQFSEIELQIPRRQKILRERNTEELTDIELSQLAHGEVTDMELVLLTLIEANAMRPHQEGFRERVQTALTLFKRIAETIYPDSSATQSSVIIKWGWEEEEDFSRLGQGLLKKSRLPEVTSASFPPEEHTTTQNLRKFQEYEAMLDTLFAAISAYADGGNLSEIQKVRLKHLQMSLLELIHATLRNHPDKYRMLREKYGKEYFTDEYHAEQWNERPGDTTGLMEPGEVQSFLHRGES